jgi:hypothetical protein
MKSSLRRHPQERLSSGTQAELARKHFPSPRHLHLIIQRLLPPSTTLVRNRISRWQSPDEGHILNRRFRAIRRPMWQPRPIWVPCQCKAGKVALHNVCQRRIDGHTGIKR